MTNSQFPSARKAGLVVQEMPDEVLVYDVETNKAHCLNRTAAKVWNSCDGTRSVSEIAGLLTKNGSEVSEDLVWLAIDQLNESNLLEAEVATKFAGESRRSVIKKIGLASMVAIPVVASLVAPQNALAAQSCRCTVDANCSGPNVNCPAPTCNGSGLCASPLAPSGKSAD